MRIGIFLISVFLFVVQSSYADSSCPNLTGAYAECVMSDGHPDRYARFVITQKTENEVTSYVVDCDPKAFYCTPGKDAEVYVADGVARPYRGDQSVMSSITCKDRALVISTKFSDGSLATSEMAYQLFGSTALKMSGHWVYRDSNTEDHLYSKLCKRVRL